MIVAKYVLILKEEKKYHEPYNKSLNSRLPLRLRLLTMVPLVDISSGLWANPLPMLSGKVLMERLKHLKKSFQNLIHCTGLVLGVRVRQQRRMFCYQIIWRIGWSSIRKESTILKSIIVVKLRIVTQTISFVSKPKLLRGLHSCMQQGCAPLSSTPTEMICNGMVCHLLRWRGLIKPSKKARRSLSNSQLKMI